VVSSRVKAARRAWLIQAVAKGVDFHTGQHINFTVLIDVGLRGIRVLGAVGCFGRAMKRRRVAGIIRVASSTQQVNTFETTRGGRRED